MTSFSTEQFHRDVQAVEAAARSGPVVVVADGVPEYVVLTYKDFSSLHAGNESLADALSMPAGMEDAMDYKFPRLTMNLKVPDLA